MSDYTELVKALRVCALGSTCEECPYYDMSYESEQCAKITMLAADAIEELQQIADHNEEAAKDYYKDVCYYKELSERKAGRWIYREVRYSPTDAMGWYVCSVCGRPGIDEDRYCHNCGAKMAIEGGE